MASPRNAKNYPEAKAFQLFAAMCWEQHKSRHPDAIIDPNRFAEISTGRWKAMTEEQKNAFYYKLHAEESVTKAPKRKASQDNRSPANKRAAVQANDKIQGGTIDNVNSDETKKVRDANKPKGKKSALNFFSSEMGAELRSQNPKLTTIEVNKEIHSKWQNLSDEDKQKYKEMALKDQIRFETEMKSYQPPNAEPPSPTEKPAKDPKKPKAKKSAFNFFSIEKGAEIRQQNSEFKIGEVAKEVSNLWQKMGDEEKQKYNDMAIKDQARFEEEMKVYQPPPAPATIYQAVKDPNKPKKGRSAYMFFNAEMSLEVRKLNPNYKMGEVSQEVGNRWQKITDEQKQKYTDMAEKDKGRHEEEMKGYEPPPPVHVALKAVKDPNRPKGRKNAFQFFSNEVGASLRSENPKMSFTEVQEALGKRWKELDEKARQTYEKMAAADKDRFEAEMKDYVPPPQQPIGGKAMKKQKDPNKPKGLTRSFMFFSIEIGPHIRKENPEMSITDVAKAVGSRWKELDEEKRKKYEGMMENDKKRYEQEMELYNQGKFVRGSTNEKVDKDNLDAVTQDEEKVDADE